MWQHLDCSATSERTYLDFYLQCFIAQLQEESVPFHYYYKDYCVMSQCVCTKYTVYRLEYVLQMSYLNP